MGKQVETISKDEEPKRTQETFQQLINAITKAPKYSKHENYILQARKSMILNQTLERSRLKLMEELKDIKTAINNVNQNTIIKKNRRKSDQIEKKFKCQFLKCQKQYGSEASLNLHLKLKHSNSNTESDTISVNSQHTLEVHAC